VGGEFAQIQCVVIWITDLRKRTDTFPDAGCRLSTLADTDAGGTSAAGPTRFTVTVGCRAQLPHL
jgi:hypothetical protein